MKTVSGRLAFEIALHMWLGSLSLIVGDVVMGVLGFIFFQFMIKNTEIRVDVEPKAAEERERFNIWNALINLAWCME